MFKLEKFYKNDFDPQKHWENKYAQAHIAGTSSEEFKQQKYWPLIKENLKNGERYLDVGCGIGGWVIFLSEEDYNIEGIDGAARVVRAITEYNRDLKIKVGDITNIPHPDASFDGLLAIGALEYARNNVDAALKELNRVLKPGGFAIIEVPIINTIRRLSYVPLKKIERLIKISQGHHPTFSNYLFDRQELLKLLSVAGFNTVKVQAHELPGRDNHYGLYIDFPFLRGRQPYQLNILGRIIKNVSNALSPWIASTGMVLVVRKGEK